MAKGKRSALYHVDQSWQKHKECDYCGRRICVNNYDDRKSRTPRFLGLICCPWCDPRVVFDRLLWREGPAGEKPKIMNRAMLRTCLSVWMVRQSAQRPNVNISKQAQKLWDYEGQPL